MVDTSIIIDFINRNRYKENITTLLSKKEFSTTELIIMEVLQGIKDDNTYKKIKPFLESLPLVEVKYADFTKAANIYRTCRKQSITIRKSIDCIIAAVVINNDLELFSNDKDFDHIGKHFELKRYYEEKQVKEPDESLSQKPEEGSKENIKK